MIPKTKRGSRWSLHTSPWIIIGSVGILLIVVVVLASQNYSREKKYMSQILSEKGAAIIKAVEAGARTGMMGMMWGGQQVQTLIEETAAAPGRALYYGGKSRGPGFGQQPSRTDRYPDEHQSLESELQSIR